MRFDAEIAVIRRRYDASQITELHISVWIPECRAHVNRYSAHVWPSALRFSDTPVLGEAPKRHDLQQQPIQMPYPLTQMTYSASIHRTANGSNVAVCTDRTTLSG